MRKFEIVADWAIKYENKEIKMPIRSTANAAGYDFFSPADFVIKPGEMINIQTNIKALMPNDEALIICNRSSNAKKGIIMPNAIGLIDADYYSNVNNDGNIGFFIQNIKTEDFIISKGDKLGQGFFIKYYTTDDDSATGERKGGFGSTGDK